MQIGSLIINRMDKGNNSLWLWLDIKFGKYWYIFYWRKKEKPYLYKSLDGTPPTDFNDGSWIFGERDYI